MGTPTLYGWSHNPQVDPQLHTAGNFWILRDQPRNLPFPEFILFIPSSSSCLDNGLKRAGMPSGPSLYPKFQHHSQGSVQHCRMNKWPAKTSYPFSAWWLSITQNPTPKSSSLWSLASQPSLALYLCCSMTHTSCR